MDGKFCQSCGMPMGESNELYGTNQDGSQNEEYCSYCFQKGDFTADCTMEEMIDFCVPHMAGGDSGMSEEEARSRMQMFFPKLKRWSQKESEKVTG